MYPDASADGRYHLLDLNRSIADCEREIIMVIPAAVLPALKQGLADAHSIFGAEEELQLSPAERLHNTKKEADFTGQLFFAVLSGIVIGNVELLEVADLLRTDVHFPCRHPPSSRRTRSS